MQNVTIFTPNTSPKATLIIVHGMAEHRGRYERFAQFLADHSIVVMTFDQLGHGEHAKANHCLGYMGEPDPAEKVINDVIGHTKQLMTQYPNLPHFILGHSMGSFITRVVIGRIGDQFKGAMLLATSSTNPLNNISVPLTRWLNRISPTKPNAVLAKLLNKVNNQPFVKEPNLQDFNWINSRPAEVETYIADPLCGFTFTNNGFYSLMTIMQQGTKKTWYITVPKALPLLFLSGADDPVGQMGKGVPRIITDLKAQQFVDVQAKIYPAMRHEILNEKDNMQVYSDILDWLDNHI